MFTTNVIKAHAELFVKYDSDFVIVEHKTENSSNNARYIYSRQVYVLNLIWKFNLKIKCPFSCAIFPNLCRSLAGVSR
jgi:hypothetical protein